LLPQAVQKATNPPFQEIKHEYTIQNHFKPGELSTVILRVPITDRTVEANSPIEGKKQQWTIICMGKDIYE
jgi:hypothetical protein